MGAVPDMGLFSQENSDCVGWMQSWWKGCQSNQKLRGPNSVQRCMENAVGLEREWLFAKDSESHENPIKFAEIIFYILTL